MMIGKRILNYQIISLLGEGGMGSVYKAYDLQLERFVAIKIINPKLIKDPLYLERFRFEARNQAKLNHSNIVMVYGFIETKDATGFVMEFIDGYTISQLITQYGRLDLIYSLRVIQQVLIAVEYAHSMGFIHRDLKPSNIIIDKNGIAKVMDFGISKSLNENQNITRLGSNIGTIYYMSPEQIKGLSTTPRTDIYSLGITLYEMLSGKVPFYFNNDYDIYEAHLKMQPQKLSTIYPEIPKEIDELILSALNKSETKNFATAYEFRTSVEHLILNLPLLMSDATNIKESHSHKKVIKNKPVNFAIALIILLTILISVFSYYLVDKFIIKEEMSRIYEDKSNINYFSERKYFTAPWEFLSTNISENVNAICSNDSKIFVGSSGGKILISTDQGNSWIKSAETSTSGINKLVPVNNKIYATTDDGHFIVLNQNGKVNEKIKLNNENLTSLNIGNNILICGTNGLVLKSEKDRINFQKISFPNNITIYDIIELDKTIFLCCTWDGKVFKTNDEGKTWTSEKLSNDYLKKIFFLNSFRGFVIGANGNLFKTTDGGLSWSKIELNTDSNLNDIIFVNQKTGYILSSNGELFISENSGDDWIKESLNKTISLNKIHILGNGTILIASNNGLILKNKI